MDSTAACGDGTTAWASSDSDTDLSVSPGDLAFVNIRNSWVTNIVWGHATPNTTVHVTLRRGASQVITTTTGADAEGLYHAHLVWEVRDGDVVVVDDGVQLQAVQVIAVRVSSKAATAAVTGRVVRAIEMPDRASETSTPGTMDVVIGRTSQRVPIGSGGAFTAEFAEQQFAPGTRGFLRYASSQGTRVYKPLSTAIVNVRRDTSYGLPYGSVHSAGLSSIIWGSAAPDATLVVTLTRPATFAVTRTVTADQIGNFSVSVDRLIEDGDTVQVFDGTELRTVHVPTMSYNADAAAKTVTGTAPAGITSTDPSAPHSLQVTIVGDTRQITTAGTGDFLADFSDRPYLAGLLGTMRYTTPDGDNVHKPVFVADSLVRGTVGDWRADTILGQPDFSQITPNEVVANRLFNPGGVYVDRSVEPNRVYVYDAGNSRVLGLSHLGQCVAGVSEGQRCTSDSDCPSSTCQITEKRAADVVLGQPSFGTSACNGDSGYQQYPDAPMASAETLCGFRETAGSISESGSSATMATDEQGNLYVPDFFNNRVLRYDSPFETDSRADGVWGQADLSGMHCNRGAGYGRPDRASLCLGEPPGFGDHMAGLDVDSSGNLWVADNRNHRVMRFAFDTTRGSIAQEADLVLGQPDFRTAIPGYALNQMHNPASVRVSENGIVYVADGAEGGGTDGRVLVFEPPLSNGMSASRTLGGDLTRPTGLEIDPDGSLWINDSDGWRLLNVAAGMVREDINLLDTRLWGGVGVDRDGNVMLTGWDPQEVIRFSAPSHTQDSAFLRAEPWGMFNHVGPRGLRHGRGLETAAGQLIAADGKRIVFWNGLWNLTGNEPADGVIGQPDFHTRPHWGPEYASMRADDEGRLWVVNGVAWEDAVVYGYELPLKSHAAPIHTLTSPLPLKGGGVFTWTGWLSFGGLEVQPTCDCLWLSDKANHRVFRVRDVTSLPTVDVVLGQQDVSGTHCNQGRDPDEGRPSSPSQNSLCHPGALAFDRNGNLYVADHNLELEGNWRLLEYDADTIPLEPTSAVFGIPATRVFGRADNFTESSCLPRDQDPMCGPWEPAFDSRGRMVVGFNFYLGPRFPIVYENPLTNPLPIAALADYHSMPMSARFDQFDNLYVIEHNRNRILIYRQRQVETCKVSGTIETPMGDPVPGVHVETVGYAASGVSDASGGYTLTGLITGTYEIVPDKAGYTFAPSSRIVHVPPSPGGQDFTAASEVVTHNLEIHIVGEGDVEVEPEQDVYHYGDVVTLTATAYPGWTFAAWSGDVESTDNPLVLTMVADRALTAAFRSAIVYVRGCATGDNDGSSWADAYTDLQDALGVAQTGDEIWVAQGVYHPAADALDRTATFELPNGVGLYGGFAGTETERDERDWEANITVLSGDLDGNDITDENGVVTDTGGITGDNAYHVIAASGVKQTTTMDGFTITGGSADGEWPHCHGGGMHNSSSAPTLTNVTFSGNRASNLGGGMYNVGMYSDPTLTAVTFSGNRAQSGGGMYNTGNSPRLTTVAFSGNRAEYGAGMYNREGSPTLSQVVFSGNRAVVDGGGMESFGRGNPTLTNVSFEGNQALSGGGMYNVFESSPTLTNVTFSGNEVGDTGGGMCNAIDSSPALTNVSFSGNRAGKTGGGIHNQLSSNPTLTNVSFSGNKAMQGGAIYSRSTSTPTLVNCILWGNSPDNIANDGDSSSTVTYSDVGLPTGIYAGTGNINQNPLFVDPVSADHAPTTAGDYHLSEGSPAVDVGTNDLVTVDTDLDGKPRILDGSGDGNAIVDMGAHEFTFPFKRVYLPLLLARQ
jgi:predicted outer membrane repeat protein